MATDPRAQLNEVISRIEDGVGLSHRSRGKYAELFELLSGLTGLPSGELGVAYIEDYQGFTRGSAQVSRAPVGVMLVGPNHARIVREAENLVRPPVEGLFIVAKDDGVWDVLRAISDQRSEPVKRLIEALQVPPERVVKPAAATAATAHASAQAEIPAEPRPRFTRADCELLSRHTIGARWKALPAEDSEAMLSLHGRLRLLATLAGRAADMSDVDLEPFVSRYVVRGGNVAKDMWCCLYPASVGNKSYSLQVAFIVMADRAELCFCLGRASAQERNEVSREQNRTELERAKGRLRTLPDTAVDALDQLKAAGWELRDEWRKPPSENDFASATEWLAAAAAPRTGGMSVSRYYTPEELEAREESIVDDMSQLLDRVLPVLDHVYGDGNGPDAMFELATLVDECSRRLKLPTSVYANLFAALESGKHVILTGPPGTGKTTLAQLTAELAARSGRCAGFVLTTATSDWTTYETIGGLRPSGDGLQFEEGHFLSAIRARKWLVVDELNRSNFDRAFGQLFTTLSGQPVVLPYTRADESEPLTLVPEPKERYSALGGDQLEIPSNWRIIATMNVFDKSLLFEMSYALMRRFAFVEVPSPDDSPGGDFEQLIDAAVAEASGQPNPTAQAVTRDLMKVRRVKDIGPASFIDIARFVKLRQEADGATSRQELAWEAFYSFLLPQFEGVDERDGKQLYATLLGIVGRQKQPVLKRTLATVLGLSDLALAPARSPEAEPGRADE